MRERKRERVKRESRGEEEERERGDEAHKRTERDGSG